MLPLQRMHAVLVVEDERIVAKDLQQTLDGMGYDAFALAASAEEAVARASERCPDVVLMDIRIKGQRDGIETAAILRERFGVPIVFLTAHADDATLERAKKTEPHGYLLKPVKPAELRSAIEVAVYRHGMEKQLRERERWFSTTLRSIADAVITVDLAGRVTFMNPAAELLTGTRMAQGMGRAASEVVPQLDAAQRALDERQPLPPREARRVESSSGSRLISDSAAPVMDEGELLGAVMVFRDVTDQRLLQQQRELSDRLSSLGTMAAGVAHEVNNPLSIVVANSAYVLQEVGALRDGLAEGLRKEELLGLAEDALEALTEVQSSAKRIAKVVADLKAFYRPTQSQPGHADVARAIEWALRTTAPALKERAKVNSHIEGPLAVLADRTRLGHVLVNLLVNAVQAIPPGNPQGHEVTVRAFGCGGKVAIEVSDTGSGIPPEVLPRIFEPFFTTKAVGTGTGLGLSICHGIVSALGGEIQVESVVGKGSTFRVLLPSADEDSAGGPAQNEKPVRGRLLVVDDEDMVLRAIARILRDHELVCVDSARSAVAMLEKGEGFDLILSDVVMPDMTGIQLYEDLLARRPELARRMVFLTGGAISPPAEDFLRTVPNLRVEKPFELGQLLETVQRALRPR